MYTWGDGAGGNLGYGNTLRQFIPRHVEKGLGDYSIIQVCPSSCSTVCHSTSETMPGCVYTVWLGCLIVLLLACHCKAIADDQSVLLLCRYLMSCTRHLATDSQQGHHCFKPCVSIETPADSLCHCLGLAGTHLQLYHTNHLCCTSTSRSPQSLSGQRQWFISIEQL